MKTRKVLSFILALAMIVSFVPAAVAGGGTGDVKTINAVAFTGDEYVGETLTATATFEGEPDPIESDIADTAATFTWYRLADATGMDTEAAIIAAAVGAAVQTTTEADVTDEYVLTEADVGYYIAVIAYGNGTNLSQVTVSGQIGPDEALNMETIVPTKLSFAEGGADFDLTLFYYAEGEKAAPKNGTDEFYIRKDDGEWEALETDSVGNTITVTITGTPEATDNLLLAEDYLNTLEPGEYTVALAIAATAGEAVGDRAYAYYSFTVTLGFLNSSINAPALEFAKGTTTAHYQLSYFTSVLAAPKNATDEFYITSDDGSTWTKLVTDEADGTITVTITDPPSNTNSLILSKDYLNALDVGTYTVALATKVESGDAVADKAYAYFSFTVTGNNPDPAESPNPSEDPAVFDHNIDYDADSDGFKVVGTIAIDTVTEDTNTYDPDSAYIDLGSETLALPENYSAAAYSLDGGTIWKNKSMAAGDINKLLNKGLTLWLSDKALGSDKNPPVGKAAVGTDTTAEDYVAPVYGATLIKFAAIAERPAATKMAVNYSIHAAVFGEAGQWTLTEKNAVTADAAKLAVLQVAVAAADKKTADTNGWGRLFTGEGINVKELPGSGKPEKTVYLVRTAPVVGATNTPASKLYKVTASSQIKAPALKADYKKEIIKPKADIQIATVTNAVGADGKFAADTVFMASETVTVYAKGDTALKTGFPLGSVLTETETAVLVQLKGTAKKPASGVQTIILAPRAKLTDSTLSPAKGKLKLDKSYEVLKDASTGKYAGLPKITGASAAGIKDVRVKATAKATKEGKYTGTAASKNGTLFYSWGVYNPGEKSEKSGITSAILIGQNYKDGELTLYPISNSGIEEETLELTFAVKGVPADEDVTAYLKAALTPSATGASAIDAAGFDEIEIAAADQPYGFTDLPGIIVFFDGSAEPGSVKVEASDEVTSTAPVTKVNAVTVAVEWTDVAKAIVAMEIIEAYDISDKSFEDADELIEAVEAMIAADTTLPAGGTFTVTAESATEANVAIMYGAMKANEAIEVTVGGNQGKIKGTVIFNANGGTGTMESITAFSIDAAPECTFTAPSDPGDQVFLYWSVTNPATKITKAVFPINLIGELTLYAVWGNAPTLDSVLALVIADFVADHEDTVLVEDVAINAWEQIDAAYTLEVVIVDGDVTVTLPTDGDDYTVEWEEDEDTDDIGELVGNIVTIASEATAAATATYSFTITTEVENDEKTITGTVVITVGDGE